MVNPTESRLIVPNSVTRTRGYMRHWPKPVSMNRIAAIIVASWVVLAVGVAGIGTAGASPTDDVSDVNSRLVTDEAASNDTLGNETDTNETVAGSNETENENASVAPGARLAGVLGVQQAEFQGEVESRSFGLSIAAANSNNSKVRLLANHTERLEQRLQELENRTERLNESYRNGTIETGTYHARLAQTTAQIRTLERLSNQSVETARHMPQETLRAHGVNVSHLEQLRTHARNMTGSQVSEIARQMAGPQVGQPMGQARGPPEERPGHGPPGKNDSRPGNNSQHTGPPSSNETMMGNGTNGSPGGNQGTDNTSNPGNNGGNQGNSGGNDSAADNRSSLDDVMGPVSVDVGGPISALMRFVSSFAA